MTTAVREMIDAVFDVSGDRVPVNYPFALWSELARLVPELAAMLRSASCRCVLPGAQPACCLPRRAKLVVRLPPSLAAEVASLSGQELELDGHRAAADEWQAARNSALPDDPCAPGGWRRRMRWPSSSDVAATLPDLGITANLICGRHNSLVDGDTQIHGFSLVIHDLKPEDSLHLQYAGLGSHRQYGCGVFVPYKVISDLN